MLMRTNLAAVQRQHVKEAEAEVRDIKCAIRTECHTCWKRQTSRDCLDSSTGVYAKDDTSSWAEESANGGGLKDVQALTVVKSHSNDRGQPFYVDLALSTRRDLVNGLRTLRGRESSEAANVEVSMIGQRGRHNVTIHGRGVEHPADLPLRCNSIKVSLVRIKRIQVALRGLQTVPSAVRIKISRRIRDRVR